VTGVQTCALPISAPSREEARKIAGALLEKREAACVNIIPAVDSHFRWEGKLDRADECLLIAKTRAALLDSVIASVKRLHSYTVPEIIALPIVGGNPDYLEWIYENTIAQEPEN
jgi:periplasmic divalent cation tolerance protein